MKNTLLIFVAHADDAEIFMGGAIIKHTAVGEVVVVTQCGEQIRKEEALTTARLLNISLELVDNLDVSNAEAFIHRYEPKIIVTHYSDDSHPDHRSIFSIVTEAVKNTKIKFGIPQKYYSFDTYNSVGLNSYFIPDIVLDVSVEFEFKIKAIDNYKSQPIDYFKKMAIAMGTIWGARIGCAYGEAFKRNNILGLIHKAEYL